MENNELINRKLKITVSGEEKSGKTTLSKIIKDCLERDYVFRTLFANAQISMEEKVESIPDRVEIEKEESENKPE